MESTICLLIEWTLKAGGLFEADSAFLIEKGPCAAVEYIAFRLEGELGHAPKTLANAFADVWKQALVIRVEPCF